MRGARLAGVFAEGARRDAIVLNVHGTYVLRACLSNHQLLVCDVFRGHLHAHFVSILVYEAVLSIALLAVAPYLLLVFHLRGADHLRIGATTLRRR